MTTKSGLTLTPAQESFAQAYTALGTDTFCNAYQSLIATRKWNGGENGARTYAATIRNHPVVASRIKELLAFQGFQDDDIDLEHLKVIKQDKDFTNKMRAIQEYNRLKGRGAQQGQILNVNIINFADVLNNQHPTQLRPDETPLPTVDLGE